MLSLVLWITLEFHSPLLWRVSRERPMCLWLMIPPSHHVGKGQHLKVACLFQNIHNSWRLEIKDALPYLFILFEKCNFFNQYNILIMETFLKIQKNKVRKNIQTKMKLMNRPTVSLFSVLFCISFWSYLIYYFVFYFILPTVNINTCCIIPSSS